MFLKDRIKSGMVIDDRKRFSIDIVPKIINTTKEAK